MTRFAPSWRPMVASILDRHGRAPGQLLQILIEVQETLHGIPEEVSAFITRELQGRPGLAARALVGFHAFLSETFLGQYVIRLSDSITDQFQGSRQRAQELGQRLGVAMGEVRDDGRVSLHATSCTGLPDQGPAALVNGRAVTRLTPARVAELARLVEARTPLSRWPRDFFRIENNLRRKGPLLALKLEPGSAIQACLDRGGAPGPGRLERAGQATLEVFHRSGLQGRGGAGFRTAVKWEAARNAPGRPRSILCNADEGEPGTFKDRVLLQAYADLVIEGMTVAGLCVGAETGVLYIRGEYRYLKGALERMLSRRRRRGLLGRGILGSPLAFELQVHWGAGAYICGMETAMIESIEGRPGIPRKRWPLPVVEGYQGGPTVVNNVETFAAAAHIALRGAAWFTAQGTERSPGTKLFSLSGDCLGPGIYEYPFGTILGDALREGGAQAPQAVQVGGPSGTLLSPRDFGRPLAFEALGGDGALTVFNRERDLLEVVHQFARFFQHESCGLCTPCRVGTTLLADLLDKIRAGRGSPADLEEIQALARVMAVTSHCGLGQTAPASAMDALRAFPEAFRRRFSGTAFQPAFSLDDALEEARALTGRDDAQAHF